MDKTLIVDAMTFDGSGAAPLSGDVLSRGYATSNALRRRRPWLGSGPRDITGQTRTLAAPGADATALELLSEYGQDDPRVRELLRRIARSDKDKDVRESAKTLLEDLSK